MHRRLQLLRPMVNGQMRHQAQCTCGHLTNIGSRQLAEGEQRAHRRYKKQTKYLEERSKKIAG